MNWINNFLEENNIKRQNKAYLKNNMISNIVESLHNNQMDLNKKIRELKITQTNELYFTDELDNQIGKIYLKLDELKKELSTQKGRITRQTNEQNKENETNNKAFSNIFERLDKIERKLFIRGNK